MAFSLLKKLFASTPKKPDYRQLIWGTQDGKLKAIAEQVQQHIHDNKPVILFAWFPKTLVALEYLLTNMNIPFANGLAEGSSLVTIELADKYLNRLPNPKSFAAGTAVLVVQHYPLHEPEVALFEKLALEEPGNVPTIFASLDEQLFNAFGGSNIQKLMESLGMTKDESMEHNMIKQSTINAQKKIAEQVVSEQKANSSEEWFAANYKDSY